jgi:hypothetical protein
MYYLLLTLLCHYIHAGISLNIGNDFRKIYCSTNRLARSLAGTFQAIPAQRACIPISKRDALLINTFKARSKFSFGIHQVKKDQSI